MRLDLSLHQLICGRHRKNIKLIESSTGTAIYFPPPFSRIYRYCPPNANRRDPNDIFITGENRKAIEAAKQQLHDVARQIRLFIKDVSIAPAKIDSILLCRLDKVRKILEANGTYILFPPLASKAVMVRVQGSELDHVDRTVREIMALVRPFRVIQLNCDAVNMPSRLVSSTVPNGVSTSPRRVFYRALPTSGSCLVTFVPTPKRTYLSAA